MVKSNASSVTVYLAEQTPERREALEAVRAVILQNLPPGYEEGMQYGMMGYYIPLSRYPATYNGQPLGLAALASQKQHLSLYLHCVYMDSERAKRFETAYRETGKPLDMGKSCVRFKRLDDLPLEVVGGAIADMSVEAYIARYEIVRAQTRAGQSATKTPVSEPK